MQLGLLGPLTLRGDDGSELPAPAAAKERAVLITLGLRCPRVTTPSELIDVLWGDRPPRTAAKTLQTYISALRRQLPPGTIGTTPSGYRLELSPDDIDVTRFERSVREGLRALDEAHPERADVCLSDAIAMWRGEPLAELDNRQVGIAERARLQELLRTAEEARTDARLALGQDATLIGDLEAAVSAEPLRERRWEQLMLALYRAGRQGDALRAFQRLRRILGEELGLQPGQPARDLEGAILIHAPALNAPVRKPVSRSQPDQRRLPTGNVTFVFSRIEDGVALARLFGGRYTAILEEHRRIMRAGVSEHGGVEVAVTGDECFLVFSNAVGAVMACVSVQRQLAACAWPQDGTVRVRIGVHSGVAEPTEQREYLSLAVHQTRRIMDAAHGGQILCSANTAGLVRVRLPDAVALVDRGAFLLAGFEEPERMFQVIHPSLESAFPPLRASPASSHNLPSIRTSFVGRARDLKALADLLGRSRLVTVVGPGGVGKTRLAVEVASRQVSRFESGIRLADLSPLEDPGAVVTTIAGAFGVRATPGADVLDALCRTLTGKSLLILDNCEHLAGSAAAAVEALLVRAPGLTVLATSRQPLGVFGEQLWQVAPLSLPEPDADADGITASEAVQLFAERARLSRPDFTVGACNQSTVAAICRAVDGLPLALELASARVASQPLPDLASRLSEGYDDLCDRYANRDNRHTALDTTMAWSYRRLTDEEAALLRSLSVFAGGFTIDAALAVGAASQPRQTLMSLVDRSLVTWDHDAGRYRLLNTIRQFAADHLEAAGETQPARAAHAAFYKSLALVAERQLTGPDQGRGLELLSLDQENLRRALAHLLSQADGVEAALSMLAALRRYWFLRSDLVEWTSSMGDLLQREDPRISPTARAKALVTATLSAAYVDAAVARRWGEMGLAVSRAAGDDVTASEASSLLAVISYFLGAPDPGLGEQALLLAGGTGDPVLLGEALVGAAMSHMADPGKARELYQQALSVTARSGDRLFGYIALSNLGLLHQQFGNLPAARSCLEQAADVGVELGYRDPLVISSLGRVLTDLGLRSDAYDRLEAAIRFPQNSPYQSAGAMRGLAHYAVATGEWQTAACLYGFADTLLGRSGHNTWGDEPLYEQDRAVLSERLGDLSDLEYETGATFSWERAVRLAQTLSPSAPAGAPPTQRAS